MLYDDVPGCFFLVNEVRVSDTSSPLRATPLHEKHVALGAKTAPFAGYDMPIMYAGIADEHMAVRGACGVFDVSHMGRLRFHGSDGLHALQSLVTINVPSLAIGRARYGFVLTDLGGVLDDVILCARGDSDWLLVVNAANRAAVLSQLAALGVRDQCRDDTDSTGMVAAQGPTTRNVVGHAMPGVRLPELANRVIRCEWQGIPMTVSTTGYTGEDGIEIAAPATEIGRIWEALRNAGAVPAGLGARDTLRLEMGYPLHGHELSAELTPWQANLGWAVDFANTVFCGRSAVIERKNETVPRQIALKSTDRGIPRQGYSVEHEGEIVGSVTSGSYSPTLKSGIALAYVRGDVPAVGSEFLILPDGSPQRGAKTERVTLPFHTAGSRRAVRGTT